MASRIRKKLKNTIPLKDVCAALKIICDEMENSLLRDESISISNFGTLSLGFFHGHYLTDLSTGEKHWIEPKRVVKFQPHVVLRNLLKENRSKLLK